MLYALLDSDGGHIIVRNSSDVFIFNLGSRFEGLFRERFILLKGQVAFGRASETSILNTDCRAPHVINLCQVMEKNHMCSLHIKFIIHN